MRPCLERGLRVLGGTLSSVWAGQTCLAGLQGDREDPPRRVPPGPADSPSHFPMATPLFYP